MKNVSADDLWRWRNILEQALDAQKPLHAAVKEGELSHLRKPFGERDLVDEFLGATERSPTR